MNTIKPVDIAIVTAFEEELNPVLEIFGGKDKWEILLIDNFRHYVSLWAVGRSRSLRIIACSLWKQGTSATVAEVFRLKEVQPRIIAMTGICGGWEARGIAYGDVIIADRAFHSGEGRLQNDGLQPDIFTYHSPPWLTQWLLDFSRSKNWGTQIKSPRPKSSRYQQKWLLYFISERGTPANWTEEDDWPLVREECPQFHDVHNWLFQDTLITKRNSITKKGRAAIDEMLKEHIGQPGPVPDRLHPKTWFGAFATAPAVIACEDFFLDHSKRVRKIMAVEMEVASLFQAAEEIGVPAFAVKAVSDHANPAKTDIFQAYAADASATWLKSFVESYYRDILLISRTVLHTGKLVYSLHDKKSSTSITRGCLRPEHISRLPTPFFNLQASGSNRPIVELLQEFCIGGEKPKILVLRGPIGAGKTTSALRFTQSLANMEIDPRICYLDLSHPENRENTYLLGTHINLKDFDNFILDHFECLWDFDRPISFRQSMQVLMNLTNRDCKIVILLNEQSWDRLREEFGMTFEQILRLEFGIDVITADQISPLSFHDIETILIDNELPLEIFKEAELRRPGTLALALVAKSDVAKAKKSLSVSDIHLLSYRKLLLQQNEIGTSIPLDSLTRAVGKRTLGYPGSFTTLSELKSDLDQDYTTDEIINAIREPLQIKSGRVNFMTSSFEQFGPAISLISMLKNGEIRVPIITPPHRELIYIMTEVANLEHVKPQQVRKELHTLKSKGFAEIGYNAMIYTALLFHLSGESVNYDLSDLWLQGPEHSIAKEVPAQSLYLLKDVWIEKLKSKAKNLINNIRVLSDDGVVSCFSGDHRYWLASRMFARQIQLKLIMNDALIPLVDQLPAWRYEDVLDVIVTDVSTAFIELISQEISDALSTAHDPIYMIQADIWDGLNDGAWDSIIGIPSQLDHLIIPNLTLAGVDFSRTHLQRADFGKSNIAGARYFQSSLHLADMRSCIGVSSVEFKGSDWYSAILNPGDRYTLSRRYLDDQEFLNWCDSPPWINPYFTNKWPIPF